MKKLNVLFQFAPHATATDAETLKPLLKKFKPHAVVVELAFANPRVIKAIEKGIEPPGKNFPEY